MSKNNPTDATTKASPVRRLSDRGVHCPDPGQVFVDETVDVNRIAPGVVLHPGTRLQGRLTSIGPGCVLGEEGPVVVDNCRLGHHVRLKGGFISHSVFWDGAAMGSAAHVRAGTLLEEQAEAAHAVGFKQTILLPFVVTGSLINFCDVLMAGGTSRRDHSEVGSSYVHFNFTPHGDKATASLIGDVPHGVLLDQPRIFLGGQGGLVGPVRIAYGTAIPAGQIQRADVTEPGLLVAPATPALTESRPFRPGATRTPDRVIPAAVRFIGNLRALRAWYRYVRKPWGEADPYRAACREGGIDLLRNAVEERVRRVDDRIQTLPSEPDTGTAAAQTARHIHAWNRIRPALLDDGMEEIGAGPRDAFLENWPGTVNGQGYLDAVKSLSPTARDLVRQWLTAIVDEPVRALE